jgi:hypothetical protein
MTQGAGHCKTKSQKIVIMPFFAALASVQCYPDNKHGRECMTSHRKFRKVKERCNMERRLFRASVHVKLFRCFGVYNSHSYSICGRNH